MVENKLKNSKTRFLYLDISNESKATAIRTTKINANGRPLTPIVQQSRTQIVGKQQRQSGSSIF